MQNTIETYKIQYSNEIKDNVLQIRFPYTTFTEHVYKINHEKFKDNENFIDPIIANTSYEIIIVCQSHILLFQPTIEDDIHNVIDLLKTKYKCLHVNKIYITNTWELNAKLNKLKEITDNIVILGENIEDISRDMCCKWSEIKKDKIILHYRLQGIDKEPIIYPI